MVDTSYTTLHKRTGEKGGVASHPIHPPGSAPAVFQTSASDYSNCPKLGDYCYISLFLIMKICCPTLLLCGLHAWGFNHYCYISLLLSVDLQPWQIAW